jgi:hypothetical protein
MRAHHNAPLTDINSVRKTPQTLHHKSIYTSGVKPELKAIFDVDLAFWHLHRSDQTRINFAGKATGTLRLTISPENMDSMLYWCGEFGHLCYIEVKRQSSTGLIWPLTRPLVEML